MTYHQAVDRPSTRRARASTIASRRRPARDDRRRDVDPMAHFRSVTEWHIDAPVERVWDVLLDSGRWPTWWKGFRAVEQLSAGEPSGRGMRIRQSWRSHLPYTLVLDLEITDIQRHRLLAGRTSGDMAGSCTWSFEPADGGTAVRFVMDVRPTRWWMNLPVPFAGRVFAWNFDAVMRWGAEGITRVLDGRVVDLTRQARLASA
jgi:uncharacterized protein YndB with AHSA1/START domain